MSIGMLILLMIGIVSLMFWAFYEKGKQGIEEQNKIDTQLNELPELLVDYLAMT
ncbi:hypothetical protein [Lactococcus cremoris]|uniref:hypothetical protein n=1 Tax=Lactococcus lactis subsp. cremoris TaxID=1359 RepID=UPI002FC69C2B